MSRGRAETRTGAHALLDDRLDVPLDCGDLERRSEMSQLSGKVALVAGATRGAGRGIACMLGEAGASVYCTGRSVRGHPASGTRPETIEGTAEAIEDLGGEAIALRVDHSQPSEVDALCARIRDEHGGLDILVNSVWGGDALTEWGKPFWEHDLDKGLAMLGQAIHTHIITSRAAAPLLIERRGALFEITDGNTISYRGNLYYDLVKTSVIRLAFACGYELRKHGVAALAVTPGFLRSETMLEHFGVAEENWRDGIAKDPDFAASETPFFVGRAIAALAADPELLAKSGRVYSSWDLAREYEFDDVDGRRPDWGTHFAKTYGEQINACDDELYRRYIERGPLEIVYGPSEG